MRIPSGVTDQYIYFVAVDATDFTTRETGLTGFTVYRSRNGAAAAAMTTPTINETDSTNMPGVYELLLDEDMTIGAGNDSEEVVFHITASGMAPVSRTIELYRPKITAGNTLGVAADGDVSGNVDGNVVGSVASVTGAVGSVTAAVTLPSIPANWITAAGINAAAFTAAKFAAGAIDSAALAADAVGEIADGVWDELQSAHVTVGSFGEIATEIASILTDTGEIGAAGAGLTAIPWNAAWDAEVQSEVNDGLVAFWTSPATLVDLVWDEDVDTSHQTAGTAGKKLDDAGGAADPWATALPGAYGAGTAGFILGTNLDTPVSNVETDTQNIQGRLPAALVGGAMDSDVSAIQAGAITATAIGAAAITAAKFGAGAIDAAALATNAVDEIVDGTWDELQSAHVGVGSFGEVATEIAAILVDTDVTIPALIAALNNISTAEVNTEVDNAIVTYGLDHLISAALPTSWATDVVSGSVFDQIADDGTAAYDRTTDSLQAVRDRGDVSWITGGGGSITQVLNVVPLIPPAIDLANTATYRIGLSLVNSLDDLPTTAEITPGTIDIHRKAKGGTSWTVVVNGAACSEAAGLVYYDEVFDSATGYAEGDMIRVTFYSQAITADANTHEVSDVTGRIFYTGILESSPGVNVTQISGDSVAADNLELFFDGTGYNAANSTIGTVTANTDMRGTDNAALATALATAQADLDTITGTDGVTLATAQALYAPAVAGDAMGLSAGAIITTTFGAGAIDAAALATDAVAEISDGVWDEAQAGHVGVGTFGIIASEIADVLADTNELQSDDVPGLIAALDAVVDTVKAETALIVADTNELQTDWANGGRLDLILDIIAADTTTDIPALIAALNDLDAAGVRAAIGMAAADLDTQLDALPTDADVLTQVNAALDTSISELGVGVPSATPTLRTGLMLLYMSLRNKRDTTATTDEIHNDAGAVICSNTLSDDTVTFISGEYA